VQNFSAFHFGNKFKAFINPINLTYLLVVDVESEDKVEQFWPSDCVYKHVWFFFAEMVKIYEEYGTVNLEMQFLFKLLWTYLK